MSEENKQTEEQYRFGTKAVHAGQNPDPYSGSIMTPISLSTTFAQKSIGNLFPGKFEYARSSNPTRDSLEKLLASLENGKYGFTFSCGLGAINACLNLLKHGDHVISIKDVYRGTSRSITNMKISHNIHSSFVDFSTENWEEFVLEETKMIWIESPTNPLMTIVDLKKISKTVKEKYPKIILIMDNTLMSPYFQNPLDLGVDIVVHSITKYINGHSDILMGAVITNNFQISHQLKFYQNASGIIPSPFDCFMVIRSTKTLHIRMKRTEENAIAIANYLESNDKIERVLYPGLKSHPQYEIGKTQTTGYGGLITILIKGNKQTKKFVNNLKLFTIAESLGGVESLVQWPYYNIQYVPNEFKYLFKENMVRLSIGIEDIEDLLTDIKSSLETI
eukprot:gene5613-9430_t